MKEILPKPSINRKCSRNQTLLCSKKSKKNYTQLKQKLENSINSLTRALKTAEPEPNTIQFPEYKPQKPTITMILTSEF